MLSGEIVGRGKVGARCGIHKSGHWCSRYRGRYVRTADLYAKCSEGPVSALHVEMCMVQHLSLRGFLAFTAIGTNVRTSLISPPV
jgi:hypothetical protein